MTKLSFPSFASFVIVFALPFKKIPEFPSDLRTFRISFISSFEITNFVAPDSRTFLWIPASAVDTVELVLTVWTNFYLMV